MIGTPEIASDRPRVQEVDVISEILKAVRLSAHVFGRFELSAPWGMRVPREDQFSFYVVADGAAWLGVEEEGEVWECTLGAGDVVVLPRGSTHELRDPSRSVVHVREVGRGECPRPTGPAPMRFGGGGAVTTFVGGAFRFGSPARSAILESLPPVLHARAGGEAMTPALEATARLILEESARPGPGSGIVSARLAEILLIQLLRARAASSLCTESGMKALLDPVIGEALRLIHGRPEEPWTVERLARAVRQSRSAFAARFTELVGEPPFQYLTRWRMTRAAELLREGGVGVKAVAERVGYRSPASFMKAFTRVHGIGPGAYRRAARAKQEAS